MFQDILSIVKMISEEMGSMRMYSATREKAQKGRRAADSQFILGN
jgi:phage portal protein BeeE